MTTFIYYFIPEDREDESKMNVFMIYKPYKEVRITDIKENFPVPGEYYFRFKFDYNGKNVWIDFNNANSQLPQFEQKIIMKVTRVSWKNPGEDINVLNGF
ncbi:MAG: hypothetical protein MJ252_07735 [archaeon]|nr:hypothetical protein [archaeon]